MNIINNIIEIKRKYLYLKKDQFTIDYLENSLYLKRETYSLYKNISNNSLEIIAEFKRESPSNPNPSNFPVLPVENVIIGYKKAGVIGISVLTDFPSFKGREQDLINTRQIVNIPLLYKDIIIDEYQVILAKAIGTDVILLIVEILSKKKISTLIQTAKSLGLEVLMELHSDKELTKINEEINLIGVNNRDLRSFSVHLENSLVLSKKNNDILNISESGIYESNQITFLHKYRFNGFLIGENFMRTSDPGLYCECLIKTINGN